MEQFNLSMSRPRPVLASMFGHLTRSSPACPCVLFTPKHQPTTYNKTQDTPFPTPSSSQKTLPSSCFPCGSCQTRTDGFLHSGKDRAVTRPSCSPPPAINRRPGGDTTSCLSVRWIPKIASFFFLSLFMHTHAMRYSLPPGVDGGSLEGGWYPLHVFSDNGREDLQAFPRAF
ncbi:hypothetical protein MAPG_02602 [Magnaporthiopsis poae ATCC 64411]|uniref:Uncharacterized protein n=1 Tax=Magnaporthiopsis poae (strain ATCC 64411 / 73-15) TaxID=644358 RepID=A0A0C4DRT6_MAGP6|nr:hypothetical protein MAPG_02602 [Magnaporthiopsis poae ATCC 64411]